MGKIENDRSKRLAEVYDHLRKYYGIHTQGGFADSIDYSRPVISSALNGNNENITDKMMHKIVRFYPGVFNIEYLLNGEGQLLTAEEEIARANINERIGAPKKPIAATQPQTVQADVPEAIHLLIDKALAVSRHNDQIVDRLAHAVSMNKEIEITMRTVADALKSEREHGDKLRCDLLTATEAINSFRTTVDTIRQENEALRQSNQHLSKRLDKAAELFARLNDQVANLMRSKSQYPAISDDLPTANEPDFVPDVSPNK